jgi:hypothetical protein
VVVNPQGGQNSIQGAVDGQLYSGDSLLARLRQDYNIAWINIVYRNWRIVGHEASIWDEANQYRP